MKSTVLMLFSLVALCSWGVQRNDTIQLTFNLEDFILTQHDGLTHIDSNNLDLYFGSNPTEPALPEIPICVLIGENEVFEGFTYTTNNDTIISNIFIEACSPPQKMQIPNNGNHSNTSSFPSIYSSHLDYNCSRKIEHYNLLYFSIHPFSYNGINHQLTLNQTIELSIVVTSSDEMASPVVLPVNQLISNIENRNLVSRAAVNGDEIDFLYPESMYPTSGEQQNIDYEYIIISPSWAVSYFMPLVNWKTQKGIKTKILTIPEIDNHYSGETRQIRIKNALHDYYDGQYKGLKYVLLAGEPSLVPSQECIIEVHNSNNDTIAYTPCDLYYSSFKTMNWDKNNNGIYGEREDSVNLDSDIIVSRLPFSSGNDAQSFVNRILEYEKNPNTDNWENNILLCGTGLGRMIYFQGEQHSDVVELGNNISKIISKVWNGIQYRFYDTLTDFPNGANYDFTSANLQSELEKGYTFVQVDTHGSPTTWSMETTDEGSPYKSYGTYNAAALTNSSYSVITTSSCLTNDFSYPYSCLSKALMFNPNSGILGYLGASSNSWSISSNYYLKNFYKHLLSSNDKRFASAARNAKQEFINYNWHLSYADTYRWTILTFNTIGDPEMSVYTSRPQSFQNVSIVYNNNCLSVDAKLDGCRICLMSANDDGNSYYKVYENVRCAQFNTLNCDTLSLCITCPNYIPYQRTINNVTYIQNETISENRHVISQETYIGRDVTDNKPNGSVVIDSGNVDICRGNATLIKNDFEVKISSSFEIK